MTTKSGVAGKTVQQLARVLAAQDRQRARDDRTIAEQLQLLRERPGDSICERQRLGELV